MIMARKKEQKNIRKLVVDCQAPLSCFILFSSKIGLVSEVALPRCSLMIHCLSLSDKILLRAIGLKFTA
jgi:hypothetical protein